MERQGYDLFPLILGLALASAGAFGFYVVVGARHASHEMRPAPPSALAAPPPALAAVPAPPSAAPALTAPPSVPIAPPVSAAASADPADQPKIWQCDVNGQRVFADFKCSADATPTELASVNRMNPMPVPPRRYQYMAPPPNPQPDYDGGGEEAQAATPVYAPYPVFYAVRPRPHPHRLPQHAFPHHGQR